MPTDAELLRCYAETRSEDAFRELVHRHANLVYAAAVRQARGDVHLAEDIGQRVFVQLARKASGLTRHPSLAGWLHRTTRYTAIDALRARQRRQLRETEAETMKRFGESAEPPVDWARLQPFIDDALDELNETDRAVVLLRFFEARSYAETGAALGLSENAARMRLERALEKLRRALATRGCTSTAAALGAVLSGPITIAAPATWTAAVTTHALAATAGSGAAAAAGAASFFAMNKLTVALVTGIAVAGVTSAGFSWKQRWTQRQNAELRAENTTLRQLRAARQASDEGQGPRLGEVADRARIQELSTRLHDYNAETASQLANRVKQAKPALQNRGNAAPMEAIETFAWACYTGDAAVLGRQIYFEGDARQLAEAQLARAPAFLRDQYRTPEELYGFFVAADCLVAPPPSDPELLKQIDTVFLKSDRIEMRKKGASSGRHQYQWTPEGWKFVLNAEAVEGLAANVLRDNPLPEPDPAAAP